MSAQVYSVPGQTDEKREGLFEWKSIYISYELSLTCGVNVTYYKSVHHPIPTRENNENPGNFQNKSVSSAFNWVFRYILLWPNWRGKEGLSWRVQEGGPHCEITPKSTWLSKSLSFCETWNNPTPICFLLDPLTNKHYRTWSSMINL